MIPDKKEQPWTWSKYRRLDILLASDLEQLIMLELFGVFATRQWLFREKEMAWDVKDMRDFVRDLAGKINKLPKPPKKNKKIPKGPNEN